MTAVCCGIGRGGSIGRTGARWPLRAAGTGGAPAGRPPAGVAGPPGPPGTAGAPGFAGELAGASVVAAWLAEAAGAAAASSGFASAVSAPSEAPGLAPGAAGAAGASEAPGWRRRRPPGALAGVPGFAGAPGVAGGAGSCRGAGVPACRELPRCRACRELPGCRACLIRRRRCPAWRGCRAAGLAIGARLGRLARVAWLRAGARRRLGSRAGRRLCRGRSRSSGCRAARVAARLGGLRLRGRCRSRTCSRGHRRHAWPGRRLRLLPGLGCLALLGRLRLGLDAAGHHGRYPAGLGGAFGSAPGPFAQALHVPRLREVQD